HDHPCLIPHRLLGSSPVAGAVYIGIVALGPGWDQSSSIISFFSGFCATHNLEVSGSNPLTAIASLIPTDPCNRRKPLDFQGFSLCRTTSGQVSPRARQPLL